GQAVHDSLDALVARCLAKQPEERFATMLELQHACDAALAQLPPAPPRRASADALAPTIREDAVTTLGNSVGESSLELRPRRIGTWIAVGIVAVAAGVILAVTTRPGPGEPASAHAVA